MVTSGPPTPIGGAQSVSSSFLRSNSGMLGAQGGPLPSQSSFPSLVSPRTQFGNMNMIGNIPNVSSFLNQSYANGGPNSGLSVPVSGLHGGIDPGAEMDPLSSVGNGMDFNNSASSFVATNMGNPGSSGQNQGPQFSNLSSGQLLAEQQLESQNFHHAQQSMQQFSAPPSTLQPQQHQLQTIRGGLGGAGQVKLEPQVLTNDQQGQQASQLRNLGPVKIENQRLQPMRGLAPVKIEPQHSDQSIFLHQQQQQQQFLQMSRQSTQAAAQMNLLHKQRLFQFQQQQQLQQQQQQQQQQLLKAMPQQRLQLHQQLQQQNLPLRSAAKPTYEPGMCARRLTHYMYQQQHRPHDNNIEFWRKFVADFFAPNAKKKWCVSMYGSGRQTTGVFPQDAWHCEICNRKPGRGFEAAFEVLPRLFKIKYESGTLEELLYVDMPCEYHNPSGQIVLDYAKAIQESVFEQLRVVRDGQLRIVFNTDLKICSWEFCARRHEELIPRRLLIPQVSQLGAAAQKYHTTVQSASSSLSAPELQSNCNMFVASARQLAKALEVPLVNDLGYTKRYVRCLQISEVVNSMKDLIDYSRETGNGPMDSLSKFPRRSSSAGFPTQAQRAEEQLLQQQQQQHQHQHQHQHQQTSVQNANNDPSPVQISTSNSMAMAGINNAINIASTSTSASTIVGLLHQNSMSSRLQNSPYGGSSIPISSPQTQPNPSQFQPPTPSSLNAHAQPSQNAVGSAANHLNTSNPSSNTPIPLHQPPFSGDADQNDSQSSVQKILQKMMMSNQIPDTGSGMVSAGSLVNEVKNGILSLSNPGLGSVGLNSLGNGMAMGGGHGQAAMVVNGMRSSVGNNSVMNGRMGMATLARDQSMNFQHQDLENQLLNGLGTANGFSSLQFDWKTSP